MTRRLALALCTVAALACPTAAPAAPPAGVDIEIGQREISISNAAAERRLDLQTMTTVVVDRRWDDRVWRPAEELSLRIAGVTFTAADMRVTSSRAARLARGGRRLVLVLEPREGAGAPPGLRIERAVDMYPGIAGFAVHTTVEAGVSAALEGAVLERVGAGTAAPVVHSLRAGADFREPGYTGPPVAVGDPHAGTWRDTRAAPAGTALEGPGQWVSARRDGRGVFSVALANDFPSVRAGYDGETSRLELDYARDVIVLGPLEEAAHVESPQSEAGRFRALSPGRALELPSVFTGFARLRSNEPWQFHRWFTGRHTRPYPKAVVFNSYRTQDDSRSTGSHDDMDFETLRRVAPAARRLGVEYFVLDDGWQAVSGDWEPNSPEHPDPRWDGAADSKFRPRYPDATFAAVRREIAPMKLGLWISPMHFNPRSRTYAENPDWMCRPVGEGLYAYGVAAPSDGSNEAGLVPWNVRAIPHVEARIEHAIEAWDVRYFKLDFMTWLDCAGAGDLYDMHDAFLAMIDRLQAAHPDVVFQFDETNDYRLFPYESSARGPSWFQNNTPELPRLLHNLWDLAPFVPGSYVGQHALGGERWKESPVETVMAAALASHLTFWVDLRHLPAEVIRRARPWVRFYKRHRRDLARMAYPLLDDPMKRAWTGLQPWQPHRGRGALLVFRQDSPQATRRVRLHEVPRNRRYELIEAPSGRRARVVGWRTLRRGIRIRIPRKRGARVFVIRPVR